MDKNKIFKLSLFIFAPLILLSVAIILLLQSCSSTPPPPNENIVNQNVEQVSNKPVPIPTPQRVKNDKLQSESDNLLKSFGNMASVPVFIRDEPIIKNGSETQKGVAYTMCEDKKNPTIYMKKVFYDKANVKQRTNILKHELVHAWFCRQGEIIGHDERFRQKFKEVGGFGN